MGVIDVRYYLTLDHQEANDLISYIVKSSEKVDHTLAERVDDMLRRHVFIEETILFPKLPKDQREEIEYLEKEHAKLFKILGEVLTNRTDNEKKRLFSDILELLVEHNSYEESFIYDYFQDTDASLLKTVTGPPKGWKCLFE